MTSTEVSILIVSYNTREMTLEAIRSAREQTRARHEFIVVDNASTDGSAEAIAAEFSDIKLLPEAQNHGFARANNLAARAARGRFLLLLNPDTVVLEGAIDRLLAFANRNPEARIWGGRTLSPDGSLDPASCWGAMTLWSLTCQATGLSSMFRNSAYLNPEGYGGWARDAERPVDIVSGCFFLIERNFWEQLGGFNPTYFMYGEEADLCLRAKALGARPHITPDAQIIHSAGASETVRADKMIRLLLGKTTLVKGHFRPSRRTIGLALMRAWPWTRMAAHWAIAATGNQYGRTAYEVWREIWTRRSEWWDGYPAVTHETSNRHWRRPVGEKHRPG
jgi:GT2 family glycosyltransferase